MRNFVSIAVCQLGFEQRLYLLADVAWMMFPDLGKVGDPFGRAFNRDAIMFGSLEQLGPHVAKYSLHDLVVAQAPIECARTVLRLSVERVDGCHLLSNCDALEVENLVRVGGGVANHEDSIRCVFTQNLVDGEWTIALVGQEIEEW